MSKPKKSTPPKPAAKTVMIRMQANQLARLDSFAARAGLTRSSAIKTAIARLLEHGI